MPVPPFPTIPVPHSYVKNEPILSRYLRNDLENTAVLLANKPMFMGAQTLAPAQSLPGGAWTPVNIDTEFLDAYGGHNNVAANASWTAPNPSSGPLSGWYLIEGYTETTSIPSTQTLGVGLRVVQSGVTQDQFCGISLGNGTNDSGEGGATLQLLDATQGDRCSMIANPGSTTPVVGANLKVEWVAMMGGTVIANPQAAAVWPNGAGTTVTNVGGIAAGATSMTVADPTGMVVGGTLGLDFLHGQAVSPLAETVNITSVAGSTIGISAMLYPHGGVVSPGAVAVPVSAAFLNQQSRDMVRFLTFPPIAHLFSSASGTSLPTQTWPAGTGVTFNAKKIDNFNGWSGSGSGLYTFPLSGVYYVYGQIAAAATAGYTLAAGLKVNSGTINWGNTCRNPNGATNLQMTATVRRHLRVNAGDTVQLFGSQNSGASVSTLGGFQQCNHLIVIFRSF